MLLAARHDPHLAPPASYCPHLPFLAPPPAPPPSGGRFEFRVCPRSTNVDESCLGANYLINSNPSDPSFGDRSWWIRAGSSSSGYGAVRYEGLRFRLPAGVSCPGGCVLQWRYVAMQVGGPSGRPALRSRGGPARAARSTRVFNDRACQARPQRTNPANQAAHPNRLPHSCRPAVLHRALHAR